MQEPASTSVLLAIKQSPRIAKIVVAEQFLEGFVPIAALYTIMFSRVGHLSFGQIGWLFSIWSFAYLLAELPFGVIADFWSRRNIIMIGGIIRGAGFLAWILWPGFIGYAVGFALWGVMLGCSSGAIAAYLHNELTVLKQEKQFARYFGWSMSSFLIGQLASYGVAAIATLAHANFLIVLGIISSLAYTIMLAFLPEHPYPRQTTYFKTLQSGLCEIAQSKKLRYASFVLFSTFMIVGVLEELLPRVYANFGINDTGVSLLGSIALVSAALLLTRLESVIKYSLSTQVLVMCGGIVLLLGGLYWGTAAASILVLAFNLIFHLFRPVFIHHVQDLASSNERATINSVPGLASGLLGAVAYAVIGKVAEHSSERLAIGLYGLFWLVILAIFVYLGRRYATPRHSPADREPVTIPTPRTTA